MFTHSNAVSRHTLDMASHKIAKNEVAITRDNMAQELDVWS